ncbi:hypothetical protein HU200_032231 [Digitaria exilis]|uniref:Uncharacterized protein n=1 Tax=Digitaria exilis TaxID=1010633 RepID=A0A835BLC6_9POAL|nr:hypothetical protein HU200_032231 [Digitaria exilis]CAB3487358.1 unnamed protein product [Digitaria exilis]
MAPPGPWSGIPTELLLAITDTLRHLESYCRARAVCAARLPPIPSLVTVTTTPPGAPLPLRPPRPDVSAPFLPVERLFPLTTNPRDGRCVGSSNGWLAIDSRPRSMGI